MAVAEISEALKKSFAPKLLGYYLLLVVVFMAGSIALDQIINGFFGGLLLSPFLPQAPSDLAAASAVSYYLDFFSALIANLQIVVLIAAAVFIVHYILLTLFNSLINGLELNIARGFLSKVGFSLEGAWKKTVPKVLVFFKTSIIVAVVLSLVFVLAMVPAIVTSMQLFAKYSSMSVFDYGMMALNNEALALLMQDVFSLVFLAFAGIIAYAIVLFFAMPLLLLVAPVVWFESLPAVKSIKRALLLAKEHYLNNLAFVVLLALVLAVTFIAYMLLVMAAAVFLSLAFSYAVQALDTVMDTFFILLFVPWLAWFASFTSLAVVKLYEFNSRKAVPQAQAGKRPVKTDALPKEKRFPRPASQKKQFFS